MKKFAFFKVSKEDRQLIKRAMLYLSPYKIIFILSIIITIIGIYAGTIQPLIVGKIVDTMISTNSDKLRYYVFVIFLLIIGDGILRFAANNLIIYTANKIVRNLRTDLYDNFLRLPVKAFDKMKKGEFISRFESDTNAFVDIITARLTDLILDIFKAIIIGFIVFRINAIMSVFILLLFPISYIMLGQFGKKLRYELNLARKISEKYLSFLNESIIGIREIKQMLLEITMSKKMKEIQESFINKNIKRNIIGEFAGLANTLLTTISVIGIILLGIREINLGVLTIGSFVAFNNYSARFNMSLQNITKLNVKLQEALVSIKRIFELIDYVDADDKSSTCEINTVKLNGRLELKNVQFAYDDNYILNEMSAVFEPKAWNGIVGYSGIGKTTIFKLLMKFYEPSAGEILADNLNISEIDVKILRSSITYVSQEPFFFNASIKENLLYANNAATEGDIIEVCKKVRMHEYIISLENGYDTLLEEMGSNFSIGQKQRLAIARAIIRKPQIFLFDEPTSSLDGDTKKDIIQLLRELTKNCTVIVISHDFDLIKYCDKVYLLDKGKVAAQGSFRELSGSDTVFKKLFDGKDRTA